MGASNVNTSKKFTVEMDSKRDWKFITKFVMYLLNITQFMTRVNDWQYIFLGGGPTSSRQANLSLILAELSPTLFYIMFSVTN